MKTINLFLWKNPRLNDILKVRGARKMGIKFIKQIMKKDGKAYYDQVVAKNEQLRKFEKEIQNARVEVAATTSYVIANAK